MWVNFVCKCRQVKLTAQVNGKVLAVKKMGNKKHEFHLSALAYKSKLT